MADNRGTARGGVADATLSSAVALLELFAMHGLDGHGTAHDSAPVVHGQHVAADLAALFVA